MDACSSRNQHFIDSNRQTINGDNFFFRLAGTGKHVPRLTSTHADPVVTDEFHTDMSLFYADTLTTNEGGIAKRCPCGCEALVGTFTSLSWSEPPGLCSVRHTLELSAALDLKLAPLCSARKILSAR